MVKIILLGNHKIVFNGINLHDMGFECTVSDSPSKPTFASKKTLTKTRAINNMRYVRSKVSSDPISFTISFYKKRNYNSNTENDVWTWDDINRLFRVFDVDTYKPMFFDDLILDESGTPAVIEERNSSNNVIARKYQAYYNVLPFVNNVTDFYLFAMGNGYVDIYFEADAGNAWVDMTSTFTRTADSQAVPWYLTIPNISNVKNTEGNYRVYPFISIQFGEGCDYASFGSKSVVDDTDEWFRLAVYDVSSLNEGTIEIDGENRQYRLIKSDGTEGDPADVWNVSSGDVKFLYLNEGEYQIYHRAIAGSPLQSYPYTITIKASYPMNMAGTIRYEV